MAGQFQAACQFHVDEFHLCISSIILGPLRGEGKRFKILGKVASTLVRRFGLRKAESVLGGLKRKTGDGPIPRNKTAKHRRLRNKIWLAGLSMRMSGTSGCNSIAVRGQVKTICEWYNA